MKYKLKKKRNNMITILNGKEFAKEIRNKIKLDVDMLKNTFDFTPTLAVIQVGEDKASSTYVKNKSKACEEIGIINKTITLPSDITEQDLIKTINELNLNPHIHGILVQLPLPDHIDEHHIMNCIAPEKDVDGFHPMNVDALYTNKFNGILPCTPKGIIHLLNDNNIQIAGKSAVVIGRSNIVGLPIAKLLLDNNATVTICHSKTKDLAKITSEADILIVAIGKPKFVKAHMIKPGAVVIDVGVNRVDGKLVGDVDFNDVAYRTSAITPVPGGVGPMTITCLMENTIECFLKQKMS
jgi:methylenetetrahydrofolate dehydrogenase (NADP+)/methenyltetrahydrofolate cyclohydrolase